jgi:hypothetical protein
MVASKSKSGVRSETRRQVRIAGKSSFATAAFFVGPGQSLPKGAAGFELRVPETACKALTSSPNRMMTLLQGYGDAIAKSRTAGRPVSFRVDVDPDGETVVTPVEDAIGAPEPVVEETAVLDAELTAALAGARERGRLRAGEILSGDDMLAAEDFAKMLGTTRVTVNAKRQSGQILGLDGAKRGFRFPVWQLDAEGKPYAELTALHERLDGPWAVYRFLVQPHGELGGLTGREALERGKGKAALEAAESIGRDFR